MKKIIYLIATVVLLSACGQPITPEEKAKLEGQIASLNQQEAVARSKNDQAYLELVRVKQDLESTMNQIQETKTELGILKQGRQPLYVLKLHFREHKMELSIDRISFDFEIPVDEKFYKESVIGEKLGSGSRTFSFGHSGTIKVIGKRIQ
jgi:hypothetical protein